MKTALEVLQGNDRAGFTVASGSLYPFQWLWDAGFVALGWSTVDRSRAWDELDFIVRGQWADGMLPHVVYHHPTATSFPDPDLWGVGHNPPTTGITQPPVLASITLRLVHDAGADAASLARAARLWPALVAHHRWMNSARDPAGTGLICSYHPWETGMDNSPAWDQPLARITAAHTVAYHRTDTEQVDVEQRPTSDDYDAYAAIIGELRDLQYDPRRLWDHCSFKIADTATNAIATRAAADLVDLGRLLDEDTAELEGWAATAANGLQLLWDPTRRHFLTRDLRAGANLEPATSASFLSLWSGTLTEDQVEGLCDHLEEWEAAAGGLVPSSDPTAPTYDASRYWRGPVWVNVNWMVADGLIRHGREDMAERVRAHTARVIEKAGMREYFHPATGEGLGATDFSWTAALARYWLGLR